MKENAVQICYHQGLEPLEKLLAGIRRPGDFFVHGSVEIPMPRVEIEGAGMLSFPVPPEQIRKLIEKAERAPFGRGEKTIVDETVRKVWQLPPGAVRIAGKSWEQNFKDLLSAVERRLGCEKAGMTAELYKLLIYDKGAFFAAHRDTEKVSGMFGTLVVVLPSIHRGGELLIRHAGREVSIDMSKGEVSELSYAAFYTDCEHEVRPIEEGNRICLVYNLIQKGSGKKLLSAPDYQSEISAAAKMLEKALSNQDAPPKLAFVLEHQYSPAGLSFAGLKSADLARAQILAAAAQAADCGIYLGILHIEESGPAEVEYSSGGWDDWEDTEDSNESFEVVEVSDSAQWIDQWVGLNDQAVEFGPIPLGDKEVLPQGALDDAVPDEQRVHEATGNEGASFERSYHRAAIIIWRRDQHIRVLLQAGAGCAIPFLKTQVTSLFPARLRLGKKKLLLRQDLVIDRWESMRGSFADVPVKVKEPGRSEMLLILVQLGDVPLIRALYHRSYCEGIRRQRKRSAHRGSRSNRAGRKRHPSF